MKFDNRGQVTMFVIAGILIVLIIGAFFYLRSNVQIDTPKNVGSSPESFLDSCLENDFVSLLDTISSQGGYIENKLNVSYEGNDVSYLCYTINNYERCVNQEPLFLKHLEMEIHDGIQDNVERCFVDMRNKFEEENFQVNTYNELDFDVLLVQGRVILEINKKVEFVKAGQNSVVENFRVIRPSRFYDLAKVVQEIVSQESWYCNFEQTGYSLLYPDFSIDKFRTGEGSLIYSIEHKKTREKFNFAIKGCVIPPGIG